MDIFFILLHSMVKLNRVACEEKSYATCKEHYYRQGLRQVDHKNKWSRRPQASWHKHFLET